MKAFCFAILFALAACSAKPQSEMGLGAGSGSEINSLNLPAIIPDVGSTLSAAPFTLHSAILGQSSYGCFLQGDGKTVCIDPPVVECDEGTECPPVPPFESQAQLFLRFVFPVKDCHYRRTLRWHFDDGKTLADDAGTFFFNVAVQPVWEYSAAACDFIDLSSASEAETIALPFEFPGFTLDRNHALVQLVTVQPDNHVASKHCYDLTKNEDSSTYTISDCAPDTIF